MHMSSDEEEEEEEREKEGQMGRYCTGECWGEG